MPRDPITSGDEPSEQEPSSAASVAKTSASSRRTGRQTSADLAFLARAMKAPALLDAAERLAERARKESWTHAEYLVAVLQREVSARESHGGEARVRAARFPAIKTIEELDVTHLRGITRQQLAHLGTLDFIAGKENAVFLGPPGTGKTHLAIGLAVRACQAGHRVAFATAAEWVDRLAATHAAGRLADELTRLGRYPLIVVDEVGYIPFEAEAANLFFQLISNRYERASVIVTSNKPFGRWGEVFGDETVAAAMIDRLVHHAEVHSFKGDSYRMRGRELGRIPTDNQDND
ncbi:IS21-like element helper ATPase IstB [Streptomyces chartreusis]|uniref:IS21-like element helper ATPase IstB n=1 Tax=Streptomyces chartreusis TaxID=1969 RepID=UPI003630E7C7